MENSPFMHPQRRSLSPRITKLPRQPDMDDQSASPPLQRSRNNTTTMTPNDASLTETTTPLACLDISQVMLRSASPTMSSSSVTSAMEERAATPDRSSDPSEEESIALARLLMAQEAMESYAMSADFLRYNAAQYSPEDLEALQAALEEDEEDDGEEAETETNDFQYEMMLRLGEAIGDVKQERWKLKADQHIRELPTYKFDVSQVKNLDENDSRCKCLVCQCSYEEGEDLRELPCGHCFHTECVDQWLKDKDCCAYCRQPIVESEA